MATYALSALFAAAIVIASFVAVIAWRRRAEAVGFTAITALAAGAAWWSCVSMVPLFTRDTAVVGASLALAYPAVFLVVAGWWATSRALKDRFWRLSRRAGVLLAIEPVLCTIALLTNPLHGMFIERLQPTSLDGTLSADFGPLFWIHAAYCYVVFGYSGYVVFRIYLRKRGGRRAYFVAVLGSLPAFAINIANAVADGGLIDLTAVGFAVGAPVMYWVVTRQSLPALAPVAHREIFKNMDDAIIVLDVADRLIDSNPAAKALLERLGMAADEATLRLVFPLDLTRVDDDHELDDVFGSGIDLNVRVSALRDRRDARSGSVLVARDVTEMNRQRRLVEQANDQLRAQLTTIEALRASLAEQASRDYLTNLYNRRYFMTAIVAALADGAPFAVAMLDIDYFKNVNDQYGHNVGDKALIHVAHRLASAASSGDVLARYGGEEFAMILRLTSPQAAVARVDEVRRLIASEPLRAGSDAIRLTFSAGVAVSDGGNSAVDLIQEADRALYVAKATGRNRVELQAVASLS